jgi:hypothetical protein
MRVFHHQYAGCWFAKQPEKMLENRRTSKGLELSFSYFSIFVVDVIEYFV